eukprot:TRINITY_DN5645_c0_g1_i1.p1 TRINITY_DN5645_c0_g1~~TRINITY_DN5645_c0_g1_i1.p1  ORF type:complete len:754 (+),score=128.83 TRINITY_DN5645_c0_g1_i1:109-2370(+)
MTPDDEVAAKLDFASSSPKGAGDELPEIGPRRAVQDALDKAWLDSTTAATATAAATCMDSRMKELVADVLTNLHGRLSSTYVDMVLFDVAKCLCSMRQEMLREAASGGAPAAPQNFAAAARSEEICPRAGSLASTWPPLGGGSWQSTAACTRSSKGSQEKAMDLSIPLPGMVAPSLPTSPVLAAPPIGRIDEERLAIPAPGMVPSLPPIRRSDLRMAGLSRSRDPSPVSSPKSPARARRARSKVNAFAGVDDDASPRVVMCLATTAAPPFPERLISSNSSDVSPRTEASFGVSKSASVPKETPKDIFSQFGITGTRKPSKESVEVFARKGVFPDKDTIQELIGANAGYDVRDYYKAEGIAQHLARSSYFETVTLFVICVNAVWIAVDADFNKAKMLVDADPIFQIMENFFCVFFVMELAIRYAAFVRSVDAVMDPWFAFDALLVAMLVIDTWILSLVYLFFYAESSHAGSIGDTSLFRLLRLLRLSRSLRMVKLMQAVPELLIMIKGMMAAGRSVCWTVCLLVGIIYIFAIAFRLLTDGMPVGEQYFTSVPHGMGSLLLYGTIPDAAELVTACTIDHILMGALMLFFILVSALTVMNMLVGVLVEVVSVVASVERDTMDAEFVKLSLLELIDSPDIDSDGNHLISKPEFHRLCMHPKAARVMTEVGVDVAGLMDLSDFFYEEWAEDGEMTFGTFFTIILQLRGSNQATVKDIVDLRRFFVQSFKRVEQRLQLSGGAADAGTRPCTLLTAGPGG